MGRGLHGSGFMDGAVLMGAWLVRGVATKGRGFGGPGMDCLKSTKLRRAGWLEA